MSRILIIEDDDIIEKLLNEIANENIAIIDNVKKTNILSYKSVTMNTENYEILENGKKIEFTTKEFEILKLLLENPNKVFSREHLLDEIWGYDYYGDPKIVNTHIKNIRKKLKADVIKTVRGAGYKIED